MSDRFEDQQDYELKLKLTNAIRAGVRTIRDKWDQEKFDEVYEDAFGAVQAFCALIMERRNLGYRYGSRILCSCLTREYVPLDKRPDGWESEERHAYPTDEGVPDPRMLYGVPREVRSVILTACALWSVRDHIESVRGKDVAHFARALNRTASGCAGMFVEWFEDMGNGIEGVMPKISTRVLRGILFATKLSEGVMDSFWKKAAESERFPERIFTDPGNYKHRACLLTTTQFGQLAEFCMHAPEVAVVRFIGAYRRAVLDMTTITYARARVSRGVGHVVFEKSFIDLTPGLRGSGVTPGDRLMELFPDCGAIPKYVCDGDVKRIDLAVTDEKRRWLLKTAVLGPIYGDRRALVKNIFFPPETVKKD
ncbi:MAG: hypothetical protein U9Q03_05970 [Patescibacteria group bacterium]|nr:hypothetical protein [Patescibacteria group bacterium]